MSDNFSNNYSKVDSSSTVRLNITSHLNSTLCFDSMSYTIFFVNVSSVLMMIFFVTVI